MAHHSVSHANPQGITTSPHHLTTHTSPPSPATLLSRLAPPWEMIIPIPDGGIDEGAMAAARAHAAADRANATAKEAALASILLPTGFGSHVTHGSGNDGSRVNGAVRYFLILRERRQSLLTDGGCSDDGGSGATVSVAEQYLTIGGGDGAPIGGIIRGKRQREPADEGFTHHPPHSRNATTTTSTVVSGGIANGVLEPSTQLDVTLVRTAPLGTVRVLNPTNSGGSTSATTTTAATAAPPTAGGGGRHRTDGVGSRGGAHHPQPADTLGRKDDAYAFRAGGYGSDVDGDVDDEDALLAPFGGGGVGGGDGGVGQQQQHASANESMLPSNFLTRANPLGAVGNGCVSTAHQGAPSAGNAQPSHSYPSPSTTAYLDTPYGEAVLTWGATITVKELCPKGLGFSSFASLFMELIVGSSGCGGSVQHTATTTTAGSTAPSAIAADMVAYAGSRAADEKRRARVGDGADAANSNDAIPRGEEARNVALLSALLHTYGSSVVGGGDALSPPHLLPLFSIAGNCIGGGSRSGSDSSNPHNSATTATPAATTSGRLATASMALEALRASRCVNNGTTATTHGDPSSAMVGVGKGAVNAPTFFASAAGGADVAAVGTHHGASYNNTAGGGNSSSMRVGLGTLLSSPHGHHHHAIATTTTSSVGGGGSSKSGYKVLLTPDGAAITRRMTVATTTTSGTTSAVTNDPPSMVRVDLCLSTQGGFGQLNFATFHLSLVLPTGGGGGAASVVGGGGHNAMLMGMMGMVHPSYPSSSTSSFLHPHSVAAYLNHLATTLPHHNQWAAMVPSLASAQGTLCDHLVATTRTSLEKEEALLSSFVVLLNEKKRKIRELLNGAQGQHAMVVGLQKENQQLRGMVERLGQRAAGGAGGGGANGGGGGGGRQHHTDTDRFGATTLSPSAGIGGNTTATTPAANAQRGGVTMIDDNDDDVDDGNHGTHQQQHHLSGARAATHTVSPPQHQNLHMPTDIHGLLADDDVEIEVMGVGIGGYGSDGVDSRVIGSRSPSRGLVGNHDDGYHLQPHPPLVGNTVVGIDGPHLAHNTHHRNQQAGDGGSNTNPREQLQHAPNPNYSVYGGALGNSTILGGLAGIGGGVGGIGGLDDLCGPSVM